MSCAEDAELDLSQGPQDVAELENKKPAQEEFNEIQRKKDNAIVTEGASAGVVGNMQVDTMHQSRGFPIKTKVCLPLLREQAMILESQSKYEEASQVIEEILAADENISLEMKLLMAVCYLYLGREKRANKTVQEMKQIILSDPGCNANKLMRLIEHLQDNSRNIRALILLPIASEIYQRGDTSNAIIDNIYRCLDTADDCVQPLLEVGGRQRIIALDFGVQYMISLLDVITEQVRADPKKRVKKIVKSCMLISHNFRQIDENSKANKYYHKAIEAMEEQFGDMVALQRLYGILWGNLAVGYLNMKVNVKGRDACMKAISALKKAKDYDDEDIRESDIKKCQKYLEKHLD